MRHYDLIVIGSGPGGEKAAVQAAKLGKSVLVVDRGDAPGGSCMHTGTVPSKTLRQSVRYLSLLRQKAVYGMSVQTDTHLTVNSLMHRKRGAIQNLVDRLERTFDRNGVTYTRGEAAFVDDHTLQIHLPDGLNGEQVTGDYFLIATGSRPYRPPGTDFAHPRIKDSDTILDIERIPKSLTIIGAGVVGCEYATIFNHMDVKVNLVNPRQQLLDFLDQEVSNALAYLMREGGIRIRLGETLSRAEADGDCAYAHLESGKVLKSDFILFANGRVGNTESLGVDAIGLELTSRKQLEVNGSFQTALPHVYAVGDVIGYPALASTAQHQGRLAALHMFGDVDVQRQLGLLPTGIYTIPEISFVGRTEEQLTAERVPYEVGSAYYREIAKGQIAGDAVGRLKLLFHRETLALLGVHILGDYASDLVHIGQTVMAFGGTVEFFVENVFNYPTYSESYRVAALNGLNRL